MCGSGTNPGMTTVVENIQIQIKDILKGNWWKKLKDNTLLSFAQKQLSKHISNTAETNNRISASSASSSSSSSYPESSSSFPTVTTLENRIVLARRGDCLFEEKAGNVQDRNGTAIIIHNREVRVI
jgi:hypothetical protein